MAAMVFERYAEELIADAIANGDLEPRRGLGEPITDLDPDPAWWIRAFVRRERLSERWANVGSSIDIGFESAVQAPTLPEARCLLAAANRTVRQWNVEAPPDMRFEERSEIWLLDARAGRPIG